MIGRYPIGRAGIASDLIGGFYDCAATTTAPVLDIAMMDDYRFAATTTAPALSITMRFDYPMDFAATTPTPSLAITLHTDHPMDFAAVTPSPKLAITLQTDINMRFAAVTPAPKLEISIKQASPYDISATTTPPRLLIEFEKNFYDFAATTPTPSLAIQIGSALAYDFAATTPTPALAIEFLSFTSNGYTAPPMSDTTAWCVNMATGGHSRYTNYPDASDTSPINAMVQTGVMDLGSLTAKYLESLYVVCRVDGDTLLVDTKTDEHIERNGYPIAPVDSAGMHRRRRLLAQGIKGIHWQVRLRNINSGTFTIKAIEASVTDTGRFQ
jgi:hypothetical protein